MKKLTTVLACLALAAVSHGASTSWSASAPAVDGDDLANLAVGAATDADNVEHPSFGPGDDEGTFLTDNRPGQGQSFTTGANPDGYTLHAITCQIVAYDAYRSYDPGWGEFQGFEIKVGTIDGGGTLTPLAAETSNTAVSDPSSPGAADGPGWTFAPSSGPYATFALDTPVVLDPNTTYAFSVFANFAGGFELNGTGVDAHAGGTAFTDDAGTTAPMTGDRVFHLDLTANTAPSPEAPDPHTTPVQVVDLSGSWDFDPTNGPATTIQVPGGGWYKQGFTSTSEADYETTINVPDIGQPQVTRLEFGAVNYQADLYVDGVFVASSTQSHTAASFDITDHVTPGGSHGIRVRVKGHDALLNGGGQSLVPNGARSWANFLPQGIFRSAELQIFPKTYISDVFVRTSVASDELYYDVWLQNATHATTDLTLTGTLGSWNGDSWGYPTLPGQNVSLPPGTTKITVGPVTWGLGSGSYWWPNVPYQPGYTAKLHELNLSLEPSGGGTPLHTNTTRFGFRECTQGPDGPDKVCYFLNGIRVNFRGDSLQGANYDRIDNGGQGDAYSTHPGFLPGPNGWPKAVDHYQRLNYNIVRIHQIPATPYMLDVCDEMGLMIIDETGIRGAGNQQDFVGGHDNMVNHLKALFTQNRNHASVVRQSISNEPDHSPTDSIGFQQDLYDAAMEVDGTRPLSIDAAWYDYHPSSTYGGLAYDNFSVFRHYGEGNNKWGQYTDEVFERSDRPYGSGEHLWDNDNTAQGFAWFATSTQAMRAKGASDIRPYTLLSAWASVIPGVQTTQMQLENPPWNPSPYYPLYGEDNLPDPWSNEQIQRVQAGFSPVLVADVDYWETNKLSNANGGWPANVPALNPGAGETRTLRIYNDTFSGTAVDVSWELRQDSPTGPVADSGLIHATVPLGDTVTQDITFTTPDAPDGTTLFLVLSASKGGVEQFREESQQFLIYQRVLLSGSAFGTGPPYAPGNEFDKASDGDISTYFDYADPDGARTGIDLGAGQARRVGAIVFSPRPGFENRMVGGVFEGSNDNSTYTPIYTVTDTPSPNTAVIVNTYQSYRYLRYSGPAGSYGNIAEMAFYTSDRVPLSGTAFGEDPPSAAGREYDKATDGSVGTFYDYANANGGVTGIDLGEGNARAVGCIVYTPRASVNAGDGFEARMVGGEFQGSSDGLSYTTLKTVTTAPPAPGARISTTVFVSDPTAYRYLRYLAPDGAYGNLAEVGFFESSASPIQLWRMRNFGTSSDAGPAAPTENPDDDTSTNVWEYFHGTNPGVRDATPVEVLSAGPGSPLTLSFQRNVDATDLTVVVQAAGTPAGPWTDIASSVNGAPFVALMPEASVIEAGTGEVRDVEIGDIYDVDDPFHPSRFMRLSLTVSL